MEELLFLLRKGRSGEDKQVQDLLEKGKGAARDLVGVRALGQLEAYAVFPGRLPRRGAARSDPGPCRVYPG
eukprot:7319207-Pyramimonas_sp.AAC.1